MPFAGRLDYNSGEAARCKSAFCPNGRDGRPAPALPKYYGWGAHGQYRRCPGRGQDSAGYAQSASTDRDGNVGFHLHATGDESGTGHGAEPAKCDW